MPDGFTLGQLESVSWYEFLVDGYPPHVDVILDMGEGATDALVFEYAYNYESHAAETWPTYDALTGDWYQTFSDDGNGPSEITGTSNAWLSSGAPGPLTGAPTFYYHTLEYWKVTGDQGIDENTQVLRLEIEVDNWIAQTEAYVDDIEINGVNLHHIYRIYDFEEEPENLGAEGFLNQASAYLEDGEVNLAARSLASARNILGRVNGLLNSMIKIHKVAKTERFIYQVEHRIEGLENKIEKLRSRRGAVETNKAMASMNRAKGRLNQLGANLSADNVDDVIDAMEIEIEYIDATRDEVGGEDSDILEAIDRLEAKIRVLKASSAKLAKKGSDTSDIDDELDVAESLLDEAVDSLVENDAEKAETLLEQADDIVVEASNNLRTIRQPNKIKVNIHSRPEKKIK